MNPLEKKMQELGIMIERELDNFEMVEEVNGLNEKEESIIKAMKALLNSMDRLEKRLND